jgi:hypothetical protein
MSLKASAQGGYTDVDTGGIKWNELRKLLNLEEEFNRPDREGAFGAWRYDPETKTQKFEATSEGMKAAQARMDRRLAGEGFTPYQPPSQVSAMTDALMADRMQKMGLLTEQPELAGQYGERFADRSGSGFQSGQPMPPPPPAQGQPPQQGMPPMPPRPPMGRNPRDGSALARAQTMMRGV